MQISSDIVTVLLRTLAFLGVLFVGWWVFLGLVFMTEGRYIGPVIEWLREPSGPGAWGRVLHVGVLVSIVVTVRIAWHVVFHGFSNIQWAELLGTSGLVVIVIEVILLSARWPQRSDGPAAGWGITPRSDPAQARAAIVSKDGSTSLLLTDTAIVLQANDRGRTEGRRRRIDAQAEKGARRTKSLLPGWSSLNLFRDNSLTHPLSATQDVEYRDGRLVITGPDGEATFADREFQGAPLAEKALKQAMQQFSEADARNFAERVREGLGRSEST